MRKDATYPGPPAAKPILRHRLRLGGLCVLTGAAVLATAAIPGTGTPSAGPITVPGAPAALVAADNDHPVQSTTGLTASVLAASGAPGYVMMNSRLIGETPVGLNVWVDPKAPHRSIIGAQAVQAVSELRQLGLNIRWRGYGNPKVAEGIVKVTENASGCQGGPNVVGMTWPYWMKLPNSDLYTYRAAITLCPRLFTNYGSWQRNATIRHELGHVVGLGHTNYVYGGSYQVMNAVNHAGIVTYRVGDKAGLRKLAANNNRVKSEIPPSGHFDRSALAAGNKITFSGWALLTYAKSRGVTITITDGAKVIAHSGTTVVRPDVNNRLDRGSHKHGFAISIPWVGGRHSYCVTATSTVNRVAVAHLGCVTWS